MDGLVQETEMKYVIRLQWLAKIFLRPSLVIYFGFVATAHAMKFGDEESLLHLTHADPAIRIEALNELRGKDKPHALASLNHALGDPNVDVRLAAAKTLSEFGQYGAKILVKGLRDRDVHMRRVVAGYLWHLAAKETVPGLIEGLVDLDAETRNFCASALGAIGDPQAVPALLRTLLDIDGYVVQKAAEAVGLCGNKAISLLEVAVKDPNFKMRRGLAESLRYLKNPHALQWLLTLLTDQDDRVRAVAAQSLFFMKDPKAVPALLVAMEDFSPDVRVQAVGALGQCGDFRAVPRLIKALGDSDRRTKESSLRALGYLKDPRIVPELIRVLKDKEVGVRQGAIEALRKQPGAGSAVPGLIEMALSDPDDITRGGAISLLGQLKDARAIPALIQNLKNKWHFVRQEAAWALSNFQDPKVIQALRSRSNDPNEKVKMAIHQALVKLGDVKPDE